MRTKAWLDELKKKKPSPTPAYHLPTQLRGTDHHVLLALRLVHEIVQDVVSIPVYIAHGTFATLQVQYASGQQVPGLMSHGDGTVLVVLTMPQGKRYSIVSNV